MEEEYPALHGIHEENEVAATLSENFPAGQSRQLAALEAPINIEYFPATQLAQTSADVCPAAVPYLPLAQLLQE